ncbi:MAG TPA: hypothetical protein VNN18_06555 [Candidatus Xenobia bacterium]|nr:hypothetical protein [Candidatus Xenobia bacterium]
MAKCPECGAVLDIDVDEIEEGEILSCPDCAVDLEVVSLNPLELNILSEEDEEEEEEAEEEEEEPDDDEDFDDEGDEESDDGHYR